MGCEPSEGGDDGQGAVGPGKDFGFNPKCDCQPQRAGWFVLSSATGGKRTGGFRRAAGSPAVWVQQRAGSGWGGRERWSCWEHTLKLALQGSQGQLKFWPEQHV